MEEFFAQYGVKSEHEFFAKVSSDSIFAMRVAGDFFYEKFPKAPVEEAVIMHPDHPDAAPVRVIDPATNLDIVLEPVEPAPVESVPETHE